jgi:hypothetical protein
MDAELHEPDEIPAGVEQEDEVKYVSEYGLDG